MTNREASRARSLQQKGYLPRTIADELGVPIGEVHRALVAKPKKQAKEAAPRPKRIQRDSWLAYVKRELKQGADPEVLEGNFPDQMKQLNF